MHGLLWACYSFLTQSYNLDSGGCKPSVSAHEDDLNSFAGAKRKDAKAVQMNVYRAVKNLFLTPFQIVMTATSMMRL